MKSMTGYGFAEFTNEQIHLSVEIRSYNSRYLDIVITAPSTLTPLEAGIRSRLGAIVKRGKVDVLLRLKDLNSHVRISVDKSAVAAAYESLNQISRIIGAKTSPSLSDMLLVEGVLHLESEDNSMQYKDVAYRVVDQALQEHLLSRIAEGTATREDIESKIGTLRSMISTFEENGAETEKMILETVRSRFRDVLGDEAEENRMYAEVAALIIKHSINEEIVRFKSHLEMFLKTSDEDGPIGKKLDFIAQELNREINTMGSKALRRELQTVVIEAKDAVESIREQIRNIE